MRFNAIRYHVPSCWALMVDSSTHRYVAQVFERIAARSAQLQVFQCVQRGVDYVEFVVFLSLIIPDAMVSASGEK
jgi:hypothetical protein